LLCCLERPLLERRERMPINLLEMSGLGHRLQPFALGPHPNPIYQLPSLSATSPFAVR
jgi:hypothetical protein